MLLTFDKDKFVLQRLQRMYPTPDTKVWKFEIETQSYSTSNIKEAARFRSVADSKASRVFDKLALKAMPFPAGGLLIPKGETLLPFQKDLGIPFILKQNRTYLAHQPGLGKSAQSIVAASSKGGKTLIIAPSFLKTTWAREITRWAHKDFPSIAIVPETNKQYKMNWDADFTICSDSMLGKLWVIDGLTKLKARNIFIDEAHRFKNPAAIRSVGLFGGKVRTRSQTVVSKGLIYNAETVCALSGTPMLAKPIELWSILYAMAPETIDFMSYHSFGFRYGDAFQDERGRWIFTGSANEAELNKRIIGTFMQRIRKEDVLKDLPSKVREIVVMDTDPRKPDVVQFDEQLSGRLESSGFEPPSDLGGYAIVRHENGKAKVQWVAKMVTEYLFNNPDESIILFAHHRDVVTQLADRLKWYWLEVVQGGISNERRTKIEDAFQSGKCRLIIGNIDAMNLGLTLTKASRVIFCEYAWTPALNEQAEDRAHRIGQKDSVFVQYVVLPNSMDEKMLTNILKKQTSIERVIDQ